MTRAGMGAMTIWHWIVLLVIVLLLFGAGKVPRLMGDMTRGPEAAGLDGPTIRPWMVDLVVVTLLLLGAAAFRSG